MLSAPTDQVNKLTIRQIKMTPTADLLVIYRPLYNDTHARRYRRSTRDGKTRQRVRLLYTNPLIKPNSLQTQQNQAHKASDKTQSRLSLLLLFISSSSIIPKSSFKPLAQASTSNKPWHIAAK